MPLNGIRFTLFHQHVNKHRVCLILNVGTKRLAVVQIVSNNNRGVRYLIHSTIDRPCWQN